MKESLIDRKRTVVVHGQAAAVAQPCEGALHNPASPIPPQRSTILRRRYTTIASMGHDQFDAAGRQPLAQRIAVVAASSRSADAFQLYWLYRAAAGAHLPF